MPWQKQFDETTVLEQAMAAFWQHGYAATSLQDLVEATGVNRASLYATFGDKHALFLAALRHYARTIHFQRLADLDARYSPRESIRRSLLAFLPAPRSPKGNRGCFLTNTALELAAHDRAAGTIVARAQAATEAFYSRQVVKGKAAGEVAAHVEPAHAAGTLLAALIGLSVLNRSRPRPALLRRIAEDTLRCLD